MPIIIEVIKAIVEAIFKKKDTTEVDQIAAAMDKAKREGIELANQVEAEKKKVERRDSERDKSDADVVDDFIRDGSKPKG